MVDLGTLGGPTSYAYYINESGQVAGYSDTSTGELHAFFWTKEDGMVDLGTLGGSDSLPSDLNESGQVVGSSHTESVNVHHAFFWTEEGGMVDLGTLGGSYSVAADINESGQVVGSSATSTGEWHATVWVVTSATPDEQVEALIADIKELVASGDLPRGLARALVAKLEAVNTEKPKQAENVLENAFKPQVERLVCRGALTPEAGQALIAAADAIIERLTSAHPGGGAGVDRRGGRHHRGIDYVAAARARRRSRREGVSVRPSRTPGVASAAPRGPRLARGSPRLQRGASARQGRGRAPLPRPRAAVSRLRRQSSGAR